MRIFILFLGFLSYTTFLFSADITGGFIGTNMISIGLPCASIDATPPSMMGQKTAFTDGSGGGPSDQIAKNHYVNTGDHQDVHVVDMGGDLDLGVLMLKPFISIIVWPKTTLVLPSVRIPRPFPIRHYPSISSPLTVA